MCSRGNTNPPQSPKNTTHPSAVTMDPNTIKSMDLSTICATVDNSDPTNSVVRIPPRSGGYMIVGCVPLPGDRVTCWTVRISLAEDPGGIVLGVTSNRVTCGLLQATSGFLGNGMVKLTHQGVDIVEPGLGGFGLGDLVHLKYDPQTLELHFRLDRKPNRHGTVTVHAATEYRVCLQINKPGVLEVQAEPAW